MSMKSGIVHKTRYLNKHKFLAVKLGTLKKLKV